MSRCTRGAALNSIIPISVSDEKKVKVPLLFFPFACRLFFFPFRPRGLLRWSEEEEEVGGGAAGVVRHNIACCPSAPPAHTHTHTPVCACIIKAKYLCCKGFSHEHLIHQHARSIRPSALHNKFGQIVLFHPSIHPSIQVFEFPRWKCRVEVWR
jgi:hypothetical protein